MKKLISTLILLPAFMLAAIAPRQDYDSDTSEQPRSRGLTFVQASSQTLGWTYTTDGTTAQNLTGANSVVFYYSPSDYSWIVPVTGAVELASSGKVKVDFTPANLNTNGSSFEWRLEVKDGSDVLAYSYGALKLVKDITSQTTNQLTMITTIDWEDYTYTGQDYAPVLPGTGITATTGTAGRVTFNASGGDTATVSKGDGMTVTTNASDYTVAVDGTVVRADGSVAFTGDVNGGGNDGTNFANITASATITGEQITSTDDIDAGGVITAGQTIRAGGGSSVFQNGGINGNSANAFWVYNDSSSGNLDISTRGNDVNIGALVGVAGYESANVYALAPFTASNGVTVAGGDLLIGDKFFFDSSTGKMHLGSDSTYPSIEAMAKTNILFTAGTNSAFIGW